MLGQSPNTPLEVIGGVEIYPVDSPAFQGPTSCRSAPYDAAFCHEQLRAVFDFDPGTEIYSREGVPVTRGVVTQGAEVRYGKVVIAMADPTFARIVNGKVEAMLKSLL